MQAEATVADAALDTLVQSKACVQQNRRLLTETRHLLATSRRWLNPAFAITGASDDASLRSTVIARLASGALHPVNGDHSRAAYGSGKPCVVCGSPIDGAEVEYEVENGPDVSALSHLICFTAWKKESEAMRKGPPRARGAILATLRQVDPGSIVLSDGRRIFLGPNIRCNHPSGTRLQIVYGESDGKKIALSIERYQLD